MKTYTKICIILQLNITAIKNSSFNGAIFVQKILRNYFLKQIY